MQEISSAEGKAKKGARALEREKSARYRQDALIMSAERETARRKQVIVSMQQQSKSK